MLCKKCKQIIPNGSKFCLYCGKNQFEEPTKKRTKKRGNGQGQIRKLQGNRTKPYAVYVTQSGKRSLYGTYTDKKQAAEALNTYLVGKTESPKISWSIEKFYCEYEDSREFAKLSKSSQTTHKASWKYFDSIKSIKMRDIKTADLQQLIDMADSQGKSRAVCEKIRNLASILCQNAMKEDVMDKNYALLLSMPENNKREKDIFAPEEIQLLFEHDADIEAQAILILIYSGMRIGELLALKNEDVYIDKWCFVGGEKTAAGKNRTIPIMSAIRPYVVSLKKDDGYFIQNAGKSVTTKVFRNQWFYAYLVKLGILTQQEIEVGGKPRLTPHCTRHTFASLAREAGVEKDTLARIIGHTDYETTTDKHYVAMDSDYLCREIEKIKNPVNSK